MCTVAAFASSPFPPPPASADGQGLGTAKCITAPGAQAMVPTVDTTVNTKAVANVSGSAIATVSTRVDTQWRVEASNVPGNNRPVLVGAMYLVATGGASGNGFSERRASLTALINRGTINAVGTNGTFRVVGTTYASDGTPRSFIEMKLGGMNDLYGTSETTNVGALIPLRSTCSCQTNVSDSSGAASAISDGSSDAWFWVQNGP